MNSGQAGLDGDVGRKLVLHVEKGDDEVRNDVPAHDEPRSPRGHEQSAGAGPSGSKRKDLFESLPSVPAGDKVVLVEHDPVEVRVLAVGEKQGCREMDAQFEMRLHFGKDGNVCDFPIRRVPDELGISEQIKGVLAPGEVDDLSVPEEKVLLDLGFALFEGKVANVVRGVIQKDDVVLFRLDLVEQGFESL